MYADTSIFGSALINEVVNSIAMFGPATAHVKSGILLILLPYTKETYKLLFDL